MFRTLIYPSSGPCDYSVELPHWSYCSWFDVCWNFGVVGLEWYTCCRLQHVSDINISIIRSLRLFCWITTLVVLVLMMDILMSETCWAHKKCNIIANDKLVFYSSTRCLCVWAFETYFRTISRYTVSRVTKKEISRDTDAISIQCSSRYTPNNTTLNLCCWGLTVRFLVWWILETHQMLVKIKNTVVAAWQIEI